MAWRFRKRFRILRGVKLNLSRSGISTTLGVPGLSLNLGPRGARTTLGISGSGVSTSYLVGTPHFSKTTQPPGSPGSVEQISWPIPPVEQFTSPSLNQIKTLLLQAREEQIQHTAELATAQALHAANQSRVESWEEGFILRRFLVSRFARIVAAAQESAARLSQLRGRQRLPTVFSLSEAQQERYDALCEAFSAFARSERVWDITGSNWLQDRMSATFSVARRAAAFSLDSSLLIDGEFRAPELVNSDGVCLFLYPAFCLCQGAGRDFALIAVSEIAFTVRPLRYLEEDLAPQDSARLAITWEKVNKDGGPDRRFKDNNVIPILQYAVVTLSSTTGLRKEYLVSNFRAAESFGRAWPDFVSVLAGRVNMTSQTK
jgi:hypothetical protein